MTPDAPTHAPAADPGHSDDPARRHWLNRTGAVVVLGLVLGTIAPLASTVHPLVDLLGQFLPLPAHVGIG